jgi:hypothetical protein
MRGGIFTLRQAGQCTVEFAIGAGVMTLLLLGTQIVSNYQDVQRRSLSAARDLAFQAVWMQGREPQNNLQQRIHARHFNDPRLHDPTGRASWVDADRVAIQLQSGRSPGRVSGAADALLVPLRAVGGLLTRYPDLSAAGHYTALVNVQTRDMSWLPDPFAGPGLAFGSQFSLLGDEWNASGPAHVRDRASALVPTAGLSRIIGLWRVLSVPLSLLEPSLREFCPGLIEPERIPEDRLSVAGRDNGIRPCP